jgi:hypothetical protein
MISELYRGYGMRIHTSDITPAKVIGAITQFAIPDDVQVEREQLDGNVFPSLTTLMQHQERIDVTSLNVDQVMDVIGPVGLCARGTNAQTGVEFFLSRIDQCTPGVDVSAVNMRVRSYNASATAAKYGMFTPGQITANHAANASASFSYTPMATGGNAGLSISDAVALPAIADTKSRFTLAELFSVNGVPITGKKGLTINFGASLLKESADGSLAPEWVSLDNLMGTITVTGINPKWALDAGIPRGGKKFAHANFRTFLRKRKPDSATGFFADSDEEHIRITAAGKAFITSIATGNAGRPVETALVLYCEFDGTNAPIVVNTLQEIA